MRITLVGSRHFGVTALDMLRQRGVDVVRVVIADADDRLAGAARAAGIDVVVQGNPKLVAASEIAEDTDLIVTAHSHARVSREALAAAKLGGIGYHPSLLPRHRGLAAVEWTIRERDPIAGGTVYHLADRMDTGARGAGLVFRQKGRNRAGIVGARAGAIGPETAGRSDRLRQYLPRPSRQTPGRAIRNQRTPHYRLELSISRFFINPS